MLVASGSLNDTLQSMSAAAERPLVVTSAERSDILLGLAAANMSGSGPHAAGVLATDSSKLGMSLLPVTTTSVILQYQSTVAYATEIACLHEQMCWVQSRKCLAC